MPSSRPDPMLTGPETRVVMFSGGVGSFAAAERVMRQHGRDIHLVFTDTLIEDADLYRFLVEAAAYLLGQAGVGEISGLAARAKGTPASTDMMRRKAHLERLREDLRGVLPNLHWLCEGRSVWEVFHDVRFLGNTRVDPCSRVLKREMADKWLSANCAPNDTTVYVGIDWTEEHRFTRLRDFRAEQGWTYKAPLCEEPYIQKEHGFDLLKTLGITVPRLYGLGFAHNNCGGGCVKAGIGHFTHLYRTLPTVFAEWEANEIKMQEHLERDDIAILRDRTGGEAIPLPLTQLRRRLDAGHQPDLFEIGGCGCFSDIPEAA